MSDEKPTFRALPELAEARREKGGEQVRQLRKAGLAAREALLSEGRVEAVETCRLITFPYPSLFAFSGAALSPAPYVMMTNRMQVVQFREQGVLRTLLVNPSDYERGQKAPFFATLRKRYGDFLSDRVMSTRHATVQGFLEQVGLRPEDVDYLAFDHLHVQDLRGWLGGDGEPAYFPNARLLVQRAEWESVQDLHPLEWSWYVPDGTRGVPESRIVLLDGDAWLGRGVALISTPGHTLGNQSIALVTDRGVCVISENGVATESYTPLQSHIPGVRGTAEHLGAEVILNGNTRESSLEQYSSMVLEKVLAGPSPLDPAFVNFYPSSELAVSLLAPGLAPTFSLGDLSYGTLRRPERVPRAA